MCSYEFMCNGYIMGHIKQPYIDLVFWSDPPPPFRDFFLKGIALKLISAIFIAVWNYFIEYTDESFPLILFMDNLRIM